MAHKHGLKAVRKAKKAITKAEKRIKGYKHNPRKKRSKKKGY